MTFREQLAWLTDRYNGMGIPYSVIARYVQCDPSTLAKYVSQESNPSRRMVYLLEKGIKELTNHFVETMCNDNGRTTD